VHKIEPVKRLVEKATGVGIPTREEAMSRVKPVLPQRFRFKADGYIPNNPRVVALYYRGAFRFDRDGDPAAMVEAVFNANGWGKAWRNGIYDFVHYHPRVHEVLGVARGSATLRIGGNHGVTVKVRAGDVVLVPAGVGHECLKANPKFLVVGAYPSQGVYSECRGSFQEYKKAKAQVSRVPRPKKDPLHGNNFPK
jgi:uncharacterized protein YjlB